MQYFIDDFKLIRGLDSKGQTQHIVGSISIIITRWETINLFCSIIKTELLKATGSHISIVENVAHTKS